MNKDCINIPENEPVGLFKQALNAAADGIVITNMGGNILWVNPAYEKLTGYTLQEIKGLNPRFLKSGKQDALFYKDLWQTITSGKVWHGELWNKRKDGGIYLEEQSITPVFDENNVVTHYIAIKRDITREYQLQNQLNMAQRIEAIGKLTAGIAHNFNNKLASILGYSELALEEIEQYSNEELTDYLQEIIVSGNLARDLVRQMMAFSRNDINEMQSVNVIDIIKETIKILSPSLPSSIKIITKLDIVPNINADPVRLHQMLLSMAVNSNEAMNGTGVITFGAHVTEIKDKVCNSCHELFNGHYVALTVHDTGEGINDKDMEHLFLPFFTTREFEGGTGMGLSALHGMIHDQHGHVLVESVKGHCTEFMLLLPLHDSSYNSENKNHNNEDKIKGTFSDKYIMIVDDDETVANVLADILRHYDYTVEVETNSKKALINYAETPEKYNLIITDNNMPDLNGIEFSNSIAYVDESSVGLNVPVILVTGYDVLNKNEIPKNIKLVLTKPFETKELIDTIKKYCR